MTDLKLRDDLVERLNKIAQRENRRIDEVVETLLDNYDPFSAAQTEQQDELRQVTLRIYDRARRFWQSVGDERQHMTDEELDQQFWLIDHNGIPRLKSEQSEVELPPDPLEEILKIAESEQGIEWHSDGDDFRSAKDILNSEYTDYLLSRINRPKASDEQ
jgi:hypothetical protein